ncbi:DNA polymerase III [Gracilibacillus boraciitolerans JCM 21714]|uniref:DNA polymerase III n=1 Tax=Gracilibacillus boraciitolerans JCM 21714 TaxID=1298598 RepID=W4VQ70_9BACI|nr:3'-5' exonuclease [Gracilibacillus boraciitolerans]GAE94904.1 DNA polymerase III [Gracilibacillus boraciitolerans JCM 21714]
MNYVAIDFETANQSRFSPCAVGLVVFNKEEILEEYYTLINPNMEFDPYNTMIHGITEEDVLGAPTFNDIWNELHAYLTSHLSIAHNASFDMSVLRYTLDHFGIKYPEIDYLCTCIISKNVWPGLINYKLNTLAALKNITFHHHDALEDARAAAKIFQHALIESNVEVADELIQKHRLIPGKIFDGGYTAAKSPRKSRGKNIGKSTKFTNGITPF